MASAESKPPAVTQVLEMCLYVRDMDKSVDWYSDVFGVTPFFRVERMAVFSFGNSVLILFKLGGTPSDMVSADGTIPFHGPTPPIVDLIERGGGAPALKQHYCLAVNTNEEIDAYEKRFEQRGVKILGKMDWKKNEVMNWDRGGKSVYFEDPDGHVGELASRGIWPNY